MVWAEGEADECPGPCSHGAVVAEEPDGASEGLFGLMVKEFVCLDLKTRHTQWIAQFIAWHIPGIFHCSLSVAYYRITIMMEQINESFLLK